MKLTKTDKTELIYLCLKGQYYFPTNVEIETNRKDMLYSTPLLFVVNDKSIQKHILTLQLGKKLIIDQHDYNEEVKMILNKENREKYLKRFTKNLNNMKKANVLDQEVIDDLVQYLKNVYGVSLGNCAHNNENADEEALVNKI